MNIPDEAVEAAARAYYGTLTGGGMSEWGYLDRQAQDDIMRCMRAALEAAAPHMSHDPYRHDAERYNQRGDYDKVSP